MAVMSGTCSGYPLKTELGDIIVASSAFTTDLGAIVMEDKTRNNVEISGCHKLHLQVLQNRMFEGGFLWQQNDVCVDGRPRNTKEYLLLFFSRVLIELKRKKVLLLQLFFGVYLAGCLCVCQSVCEYYSNQ